MDIIGCSLELQKSPRGCKDNITVHNSFVLLQDDFVNLKECWTDVIERAEEEEAATTVEVQLLDGMASGLLVGNSKDA